MDTTGPKQNHVEQEIDEQRSVRQLYPNAYFVWFLAGELPVEMHDEIQTKVLRDMGRLGTLGTRNQTKLIALCTDNAAADIAQRFVGKLMQWEAVRLEAIGSPNSDAFRVDKPYQIAARSADMVLCYGTPTDELYDLLDEVDPDDPPQLEIRELKLPHVQGPRVDVTPNKSSPYETYWQRVGRLRRWYKAPWNGKPPLRALIRPFPTYNIDGDGTDGYNNV